MPTRAEEIRARQGVIQSDLEALEAKLKEGPPPEDLEQIGLRSEVLLDEFDQLTDELKPWAEREQRLAAVRAAMSQEGNREEVVPEDKPTVRTGLDVFSRAKRDPFSDLDSVRTGITAAAEVRARAIGAIELYANRSDHWALNSDGAEQATKLVEKMGQRFGTAVARHMLVTGTPEYLSAVRVVPVRPGRHVVPGSVVADRGERRLPGAVHPRPDDHPDEQRLGEPVPPVRDDQDDRDERLERRHVAGVSASGRRKARRPRMRPRPSASSRSPPQKGTRTCSARSRSSATRTSRSSSPTYSPTRRTAWRSRRSPSAPALACRTG
jgi:hypothetical protein